MITENPNNAVPTANSTANALMQDVAGNKLDTAVQSVGTIASTMAYVKGLLSIVLLRRKLGYYGTAVYPAAPSVAETTIHESVVPSATAPLTYNGFTIDMTNCTSQKTIRVYSRVDGTNYRLAETMIWRVGDNPAVRINEFSTARQWLVTVQTTATEAAPRNIPYEYVKEG